MLFEKTRLKLAERIAGEDHVVIPEKFLLKMWEDATKYMSLKTYWEDIESQESDIVKSVKALSKRRRECDEE